MAGRETVAGPLGIVPGLRHPDLLQYRLPPGLDGLRHGGGHAGGPAHPAAPVPDARTAVAFALSPGNAHDAPQGRQLLKRLEKPSHRPAPVMDRTCEDDETRRVFPRFDRPDAMFPGFVVFALVVDAPGSVNESWSECHCGGIDPEKGFLSVLSFAAFTGGNLKMPPFKRLTDKANDRMCRTSDSCCF